MSPLAEGILILLLALALDAGLIWLWRQRRKAKAPTARENSTQRRAVLPLDPGPRSPASPAPLPSPPAGRPVRPTPAPIRSWLKPEAVLLLGGGLLTVCGQILRHDLPPGMRWQADALLAVGLALFLLGGFRGQGGTIPLLLERPLRGLARWLDLSVAQLACLALGPLFGLVAGIAAGDGEKMGNAPVGMLCWAAGMGLIVLGAWPQSTPHWRPTWRIMAPALLLFALAFLARAVDTAHIPLVLTGDEGSAGMSAVDFATGKVDNPFVMGWYSFPSLYFLIQSFSIRLLGPTTEALRLPSAFAGALTVSALFLVARPMFGKRAALLAALFLAGFHYHIHFSRIALNNIWDGLAYVVVLGAIWHGWHTGRRASFVLAGLVLGLAQYFYASSRMLLGLVPAWLLLTGLVHRSQLRRAIPNLVLTAVAALVVVLPLGMFYARHPNEFLAPISRFSIFGEWMKNELLITGDTQVHILLRQISLGFQGYTLTPLQHWYTPNTPMLRPVSAALFLFGAVFMLLRWRDERMWMIALWVVAFGLAGGLSESTPAAQRYVAAAPAACLLVGLGLDETATRLGRLWPRQGRRLGWIALALMVAISLDDLRFYFLEYTPHSDFGGDNGMVAQRLADYLRHEPATAGVAFFGSPRMGYYSIPSLQYLAPQVRGYDMNAPWGSPENPRPAGQPLFFVFLPEHPADLAAVMADYPGGMLIQTPSPGGGVLFWLYQTAGTR